MSLASSPALVGILDMQPKLLLSPELVGTVHEADLQGVLAEVSLPGASEKVGQERRHLDYPVGLTAAEFTAMPGVRVNGWGSVENGIAMIPSVGIRIPWDDDSVKSLDDDLSSRIEEFAYQLAMWCAVSAGPKIWWGMAGGSIFVHSSRADGPTAIRPEWRAEGTRPIRESSPVTPSRFGVALELAASGASVPEPRELLLRGEIAYVDGDYRSALMDGATVLEQVLWEMLDRTSRLWPPAVREYIMKGVERDSLGKLLRKVRSLIGVPIETLANDDLVTLRNRVVHRKAADPTVEEAGIMLATTLAMLNLVSPLPNGIAAVSTDPRLEP